MYAYTNDNDNFSQELYHTLQGQYKLFVEVIE